MVEVDLRESKDEKQPYVHVNLPQVPRFGDIFERYDIHGPENDHKSKVTGITYVLYKKTPAKKEGSKIIPQESKLTRIIVDLQPIYIK